MHTSLQGRLGCGTCLSTRQPRLPCLSSWQLSNRPVQGYTRSSSTWRAPSTVVGLNRASEQRPGSLQVAHASPEPLYTASTDVRGGPLIFIGVGPRGSSAVSQLQGDQDTQGAKFWSIDMEGKAKPPAAGVTQLLVQPGQDLLLQKDLQRICPLQVPSTAAGSTGSMMLSTSGVAFIIAGAAAIPGGSPLLLQLAAHLRRQGLFVATELTMPFDFEGRRKLEEADALVEALSGVAQLTVLVSQEVLCRAYAELTITEASTISDTTLVYIARSILWAVSAPEVLIATPRGMTWHGRDLRRYRRLLAPPLERLLTCPGTGALGRGGAAIPRAAAMAAPLASILSTLAEDSVKAAADSPFLENAIGAAGAVLIILTLPSSALLLEGGQRPTEALNDPEKYALRAAVQVAAMTALEVAGPQCQDVVVCAHVTEQQPNPEQQDLSIEATMLVLEDPAAAEAWAAASSSGGTAVLPPRTISPEPGRSRSPQQPPAAAGPSPEGTTLSSSGSSFRSGSNRRTRTATTSSSGGSGTIASAAAGSRAPPATAAAVASRGTPSASAVAAGNAGGVEQAPAARPKNMWSAMSAIAGGSAAAAVSLRQQRSSRGVREASPSSRPAAAPTGGALEEGTTQAAGTRVARQLQQASWQTETSPLTSPPAAAAAAAPAADSSAAAPTGGVWQHVPWQVDRMDQRLTGSLVAQSLDLPSAAARWRHQTRAAREAEGQQAAEQGRKASWSFFGLQLAAPGADKAPAGEQVQDVRARAAGMLQVERGAGSWVGSTYSQEEEEGDVV